MLAERVFFERYFLKSIHFAPQVLRVLLIAARLLDGDGRKGITPYAGYAGLARYALRS
jgi:hypothetical protein